MANQGAKKRKEENARHMSNLLRLIIGCNPLRMSSFAAAAAEYVSFAAAADDVIVAYILVRMGFYYSSLSWKHLIGLILTSIAYGIPYKQLASMANPTYTDDGELMDGGFDMSTGGICGYLHDIIYITGFVQITSLISDKFWYTYLVIPAFAAYKASGFIKGFLSHDSEGMEEDENTRKKREKMERKASRPKYAKTRTR
ncbi:hypothetical protein RDABS01_039817 [Bienertia sinuspersici]